MKEGKGRRKDNYFNKKLMFSFSILAGYLLLDLVQLFLWSCSLGPGHPAGPSIC